MSQAAVLVANKIREMGSRLEFLEYVWNDLPVELQQSLVDCYPADEVPDKYKGAADGC